MAKMEVATNEIRESLNQLQLFRSGWVNDIREGAGVGNKEAEKILYSLYRISSCIIVALENALQGRRYKEVYPLRLVQKELEDLVNSRVFKEFDEMGKIGAFYVVTNGTKHHVRVMLEMLDILTR